MNKKKIRNIFKISIWGYQNVKSYTLLKKKKKQPNYCNSNCCFWNIKKKIVLKLVEKLWKVIFKIGM